MITKKYTTVKYDYSYWGEAITQVKPPKVGIRPQLVNVKSFRLVMDYVIEWVESSVHVLYSLSPVFISTFSFSETILNTSDVVQVNIGDL